MRASRTEAAHPAARGMRQPDQAHAGPAGVQRAALRAGGLAHPVVTAGQP